MSQLEFNFVCYDELIKIILSKDQEILNKLNEDNLTHLEFQSTISDKIENLNQAIGNKISSKLQYKDKNTYNIDDYFKNLKHTIEDIN